MYIGIAHGVGYVVRFCRTPDINLQAQADGKLIAYHGFLFAHAVMGHRDSLPGHTQCPGDGVYNRLEGIRTAVRVRMADTARSAIRFASLPGLSMMKS